MKNFFKRFQWKSVFLGIARYALAIGMIPYAVTKILKTQFVILPVGISQVPLEQIDGTVLAWAFLGYAPWFQVLLGFLELIPALLLLFRKTTLAGALLMLPVLLNVCLINFALDLWAETQLISSVFLVLNSIILLFYLPQLKRVVETILYSVRKVKFKTTEIIVNITLVVFVVFSSSGLLLSYIKDTNELTGDWYHQQPIEWRLTQKGNSSDFEKEFKRSIFFGPFGHYGSMEEGKLMNVYSYTWNQEKNQIELVHVNDSIPVVYSVVQLSDKQLILETRDSLNNVLSETYESRIMNLGRKRKERK